MQLLRAKLVPNFSQQQLTLPAGLANALDDRRFRRDGAVRLQYPATFTVCSSPVKKVFPVL